MSTLLAPLIEQPLLLLFIVAALGYPLGRVPIGGTTFGVAAVLFVGLAFGALDPRLELPEFPYVFGLVLFVYTVGLTSARGLISSFQRKGLRELALVAAVLLGSTVLTVALARVMSIAPAVAAGVFAGSLTNTPALAAVLEHVRHVPADGAAEPIIGYSLTYPIGVVGVLATLALARRLWRVSEAHEQSRLREAGVTTPQPVTQSVTITKAGEPMPLEDLRREQGWQVVFGRMRRENETHVVDSTTTVQRGDIVTVVGPPSEIARVVAAMGEPSDHPIEWDRTALDYRRVFVSSGEVAGRRLADLDLPSRFGAVVTRVRRGDVEMLARGDMVLELGDRVRVVTERAKLDAVSAYFGDSYRALSEIDILAFSVGPALGLLLGLVPIPLPGPVDLRLGIAGGPLLVALALGYVGRTGPVVWVLPFSANLTLRQIGLVLFLAAIGTRAGWEFRTLLTTGGGLTIVAAGTIVTCGTAFATLWFGYRVLKLPFALASGVVAAVQTQPAVLGFAVEQARNDVPNLTYARVYPVALIGKILLAQFLLEALG
jgi:putative transport protein